MDMARFKDWLSTVPSKFTRKTCKSGIKFEEFHQKPIESLFQEKDFKRKVDGIASQNTRNDRPRARDFLRGTLQRVRCILYGSGPLDVLGITLIAALGSMPNSLRRKFRLADRLVGSCGNWMVARVVMRVFGVKYKLSDIESPKIILPQFESWMWNYLKPQEGEVFVDVGAHVGKYTCMIAKMMCQKGFVIAVEPHPANFSALVESVKMNHVNNVWVLNIAAYSVDRKLPMFVGDMSGHHSLVTDMGCGTIQITARRLDDVILDRVDRVDWVKIDVEGAELEVLKGMTEVLQRYRPSLIIELWKRNETDVVLLLSNAGYKVWTINEEPDSDSKHIFARKSRLESTDLIDRHLSIQAQRFPLKA